MQSANIILALGGDSGNQVPKFNVTPAEIAVLRAIHGDDAVSSITPVDASSEISGRSSRVELARLKAIYGNARDPEGNLVVDTLFPGAAARVFETIDELDLDKSLFAAKERVTTEDFGGNAEDSGDDLDKMKVADLRDLAKDRGVDLGDATKKADIIAKLEAAGVTDDAQTKQDASAGEANDDGIEDMANASEKSIFG